MCMYGLTYSLLSTLNVEILCLFETVSNKVYCTYRFEISMKLTLTSHSVEKKFQVIRDCIE